METAAKVEKMPPLLGGACPWAPHGLRMGSWSRWGAWETGQLTEDPPPPWLSSHQMGSAVRIPAAASILASPIQVYKHLKVGVAGEGGGAPTSG